MSSSSPVQNRIINDPELVARLQRGDTWMLQLLIRRFQESIFVISLGISLDPRAAHVLMRDVLVHSYSAIRRLKADVSLAPWLRRMAVRYGTGLRWRPWYKRFWWFYTASDTVPPDICQVLNALRPRDRAIFVLKSAQNLSVDEVAAVLGVPVEVIQIHLSNIWLQMIRVLETLAGSKQGIPGSTCGRGRWFTYGDDGQDPEENAAMKAHLAECEECRRQMETMASFLQGFRKWIEIETHAVDFKCIEKTVVLEAIYQPRDRRGWLRPVLTLLIPLLMLAGIVAAGVFFLM
ncbi:sigma-70 family RNA polymerase sigma factor [Desulfosarcina sp. OttesenSCG-928-G10]|nr:sigma-70 family RNA polymerase sigma factor [Desulfosarcina sp. OttesenSCG-928-G10]MDL2320736.1 sigma-70 family RNA polymerase sigma factor [Desulfosarcina sp. OttesenSCG-928-B08]